MPPTVILDPAALQDATPIAGSEEIQRLNPQRHEFALLDGILVEDLDAMIVAGFHEIAEDAWWARGHIPGRPLFPGVLMIEVAAQLASYATHRLRPDDDRFLGFAAVDGVKFRGAVSPPARLVVIGRATSVKPRRTKCDVQGFVGDVMVFEAQITGMPV